MTSEAPAREAQGAPPDRRAAVLGFMVWFVARLIFLTLRIRYVHREYFEDAAEGGKGAIFTVWHGRSFIPTNVWRKRGFWVLISLSRDGEMQRHIFQRFGFRIIRGSTGRGAVRGALQLVRKVREGGCLSITPDGPRGPTHKVQAGTIFLAQRAGCPVVPVGVSARWRKILHSWDSYMVPVPFSRAAVVIGEPLHVAPDLDEEGQRLAAEALERALDDAEAQAEALMGFGAK